MKRIIFSILLLCLVQYTMSAQMMSGGRGQSPSSEVKASSVSSGGVSGDVNLFSGTFNSNYSLGSVSTPSGLNYAVNLSYASTFAAGDNLPQSTGIPYGEGWNIDLPTVNISTEDYNKYTLDQTFVMSSSPATSHYTCGGGIPYLADCNGSPSPTPIFFDGNDCDDALDEGRLFWFSPSINIPGVFSGRMVFKEQDGNEFVFVPHKFERYLEARMSKTGANSNEMWTIILDDGTRYVFKAISISNRNASNQRVQKECVSDKEVLRNLLLPKSEILTWYCDEITHPNQPGAITFDYETWGEFNFLSTFSIYSSNQSNDEISRYFYNDGINAGVNKKKLNIGYSDILLKSVSSDFEKLELDYNNILNSQFDFISPSDGFALMDPSDPNVEPKLTSTGEEDPMYSRESIQMWSSFDEWNRYYHMKSSDISNNNCGTVNTVDNLNPYQGFTNNMPPDFIKRKYREPATDGGFFTLEALNCADPDVEECYKSGYLESPRIGGMNSNVQVIPGENYELQLTIYPSNNVGSIFDVNLATGDNSFPVGTSNNLVYASCYNKAYGESVYSTFGQGLKPISITGGPITFSNYFTMANLPNQFDGFSIQVGPSNSDTNFDYIENWNSSDPGLMQTPGTFTSYFNIDGNTPQADYCETTGHILRSGSPVPSNFGIGLPWYMLHDFYQEEELLPNYEGGAAFWFNPQHLCPGVVTNAWVNKPTMHNDQIYLQRAELIRYAKNPYMLTGVQKFVKNKDGGWGMVNNAAFKYDVEQVRRYVNTKEGANCDPTTESYYTNTFRNIFLLTDIQQLPLGTSGYAENAGFPNTHFGYSNSNTWNDNPGGGPLYNNPYTGNVHNTNFIVMDQIIDPLGKKTTLTYRPTTNLLLEPGSGNPVNSYSISKLSYRERPFQRVQDGGQNELVPEECQGEPIKRADPYAYQVYMVVKNKKVENEDGPGNELTWTYTFGQPAIDNDHPFLSESFSWDKTFNLKAGFKYAQVAGPGTAKVRYYHFGDHLLWGKLQRILTYDENGNKINNTLNNYGSLVAFDKPWQSNGSGNPDFEATNRMHDVPNFYETRFANDIEAHNSDYLKSFFIKKTKERIWTYDESGNNILNQTTYEYYDRASSPGYAELGVSSLNQEPSFQLYRTHATSTSLSGAYNRVEYFYLYDLLNKSGYDDSNELFSRLLDKGMKNLVFQTRTKTKAPGSNVVISSAYNLYTTEVSDRIHLKQTAKQAVNSNSNLLEFSAPDMSDPDFQVPALTTSTILAWNEFGQTKEVKDAKGLVTSFNYYNNGLVNLQIVGVGEEHQLESRYRYTSANRLEMFYNPNYSWMRYRYDDFGRLTEVLRDGKKIEGHEYSNWDGLTGSFFAKAEQSFVSTTTFVDGTDGITNTSYIDPLGRNIANVSAGVRLDYKVYDDWSRPVVQLKPEAYGGLNVPVGDAADHIEMEYQAAPRSNVTKTSKFGESISGNHIVESTTSIVTSGDLQGDLSAAGQNTFPLGSKFYKVETSDEDGNIIIEYSNAFGQKVATISNDNVNPEYNTKAATVLLYDSHGNVKKVSNPKEQISEYLYNHFGLMYRKITVDAAMVQYGYNAYGNLIAEADGNYNRVYNYDNFSRMISQSEAQSLNSLLSSQGMHWIHNLDEPDGLAAFDDTHQAVVDAAASSREIEWFYNTYDDSRWNDYTINAQEYLENSLKSTRGRLVQTVSYDLDGEEVEYNFFSYTPEGFIKWEMLQFMGNATGKGLLSRIDYPSINLLGSPKIKNVDINGDHTLDFQYRMKYDAQGRLVDVFANYDDPDNGDGYKVASYTYDDVKQVVSSKMYFASGINDCENQEVDAFSYAYDDRYRLTSISSNLFNESLYYDDDSDGSHQDGLTSNFNGNINAINFSYALGNTENAPVEIFDGPTIYNYDYDHLNRLVSGTASVTMIGGSPEPSLGDVTFQYDKITNISRLTRNALDDQGAPVLQDYTYNYISGTNKLNNVQTQDGPRTLSYDSNGNLTTDSGKGITNTTYGRANLPWMVGIDNPDTGVEEASYLYDAANQRIFKETSAGEEYYIRTSDGQEVAVFDKTNDEITWFVHGNERVAKIFDQTEVEFTEENSDGGLEPCEPCDDRFPTDIRECIERPDEQQDAYLSLRDRMSQTQVTDELFPATMNRLKLCEGREINALQREMNDVEIGYEVLQSIGIESPDQVFTVQRSTGELEVNVSLEEMLEIRLDDERTGIDGFELDDNPTPHVPSDPFNCDMTENEDPPIPAPGFYVHDHLGNTRVHYAVDCDGDAITYTLNHVVDYFPYGKILREYTPNDEQEKFLTTHHERDIETGLDYRGARFYDSDLGRFLSLDPLAADFADVSAYNYVLGNPVRLVDPDGRSPKDPIVIHEHFLSAFATRENSDKTTVLSTRSSKTTQIETIEGKEHKTVIQLYSAEVANFNDAGELAEGSFHGYHKNETTKYVDGKQVGESSITETEYSDFSNADPTIKTTQAVIKGIHKEGGGGASGSSPGNIIVLGNNNLNSTTQNVKARGLLSVGSGLAKGSPAVSGGLTAINGAIAALTSTKEWDLSKNLLLKDEVFKTGRTFEKKGPYGNVTQSYTTENPGHSLKGALIRPDILEFAEK